MYGTGMITLYRWYLSARKAGTEEIATPHSDDIMPNVACNFESTRLIWTVNEKYDKAADRGGARVVERENSNNLFVHALSVLLWQ